MNTNSSRIIGIQHRVKFSAEGEARPTRVCILEGERTTFVELALEQDELNFVLTGMQSGDVYGLILGGSGDYLSYALSRRSKEVGATVMRIPSFRLKAERELLPEAEETTKKAKDPKADDCHLLATLVRDKSELFFPLAETDASLIRVREAWKALYESMQARIACEQRIRQYFIGRVFTNPTGLYPEGGIEKEYDSAKASSPIFEALMKEETTRERELAKVLEELPVYTEIFKPIPGVGPKIAGRIISAIVDIRRFSSTVDAVLLAESYERGREHARLGRLSEDWDIVGGRVYETKYSRIRAIASMKENAGKVDEAKHLWAFVHEMDLRQDLRKTGRQAGSGASKLKAYLGVHVLKDGTFPRRRAGQLANWHGGGRQGLYLLGDQFNRRPGTYWGDYLREQKARLRLAHPEVEVIENKAGKKVKRYTDGHIHKMATWRTLSRFVESLHKEWTRLEESKIALKKAA